jgi:putative tryptophan/tyrosine transport system substrate-binding protein
VIERRTFLAGWLALVAAARIVEAQEPARVPRVGFLGPRTRSDGAPFVDGFLQGLRELGWMDGKKFAIEYRFADGEYDRLPHLAAELVRMKVDVILAASSTPAVAAKNATRTIPIVMGTRRWSSSTSRSHRCAAWRFS